MEKIQFQNGTTINAANTFNTMQDNIESAIDSILAIDTTVEGHEEEVVVIKTNNKFVPTVSSAYTVSGVTVTPVYNANGFDHYVVSGTSTSTSAIFIQIGKMNLEPSTNYTISGIDNNAGSSSYMYRCYYTSSSANSYKDVSKTDVNFTTDTDIKSTTIQLRVAASYTFNNVILKPMVRLENTINEYQQPEIKSTLYANGEKLTDTINVGVESNNAGVHLVQSKNLFNKTTKNIILGYFHSSTTTIGDNSNRRTIYIKCKPNTTYTASTVATISTTNQFALGYTKTIPAIGTQVYGISATASNTQTITTGSEAQYLVAYIRNENYTITLDQVLNGLQIEEGSSATSYEAPLTKIIANQEKYTDTLNIGVEPNNSGLWVEHSKNLFPKLVDSTSTFNGKTYTTNNGVLTMSGTPTSGGAKDLQLSGSIVIKSGMYLQLNNDKTDTTFGVRFMNGSTREFEILCDTTNKIINLSNYVGKTINTIQIYQNSTFTNTITLKPLITYSSTQVDFEPYITPSIKVNNNGVYETIYQQPVVLWTNASPTSSFASQTISLDLSEYSKVEILYKARHTLDYKLSTGAIPIGNTTALMYSAFFNFNRYATISTTGVVFANDVYYATLGSTTTTTQNDYCVPYQIIGYK